MPLAGWFADAEIVTAMAILLASWPAAIAARADQRDRAVPAIRMGHGGVCGCRAVPDGRGCCRSPLFAVSGQASERPSPRPIVVLTTRGDLMRLRRLVVGRFQYGPRHLLQLHATIAGTARMAARRGGSATSLGLWITIVSLPLGGWGVETLRRPHTGIVASCIAAALVMAALPILPWPMIMGFGLGLAIGPGAGAIVGLPARIAGQSRDRTRRFLHRLLRRDGHWSRSGRLGTENLGHRRRVASRRKRPVSGRRTAPGGSGRVIGVERNASLKANRHIAELRSFVGGHPIPPFECSCTKARCRPPSPCHLLSPAQRER
jgi:hypothetical protein